MIDEMDARVRQINELLARGMLPVTEERLERCRSESQRALSEISGMRLELQRLDLQIEKLSAPPAKRK